MRLLHGPGRRIGPGLRVPLLIAAALATAGPRCASGQDGQAPTAPSGIDAESLLADSAMRFESSGGIAGFVSGASIVAKDGVVSVEYRPPFGRMTAEPRRGTMAPGEYLALWKDVLQSGLPSLPSTGEPEPRGADRIRNVFEVRRGSAATTLIWMDAEPPSRPAELPGLVDAVVGTARNAVGESKP
jgi:hypothetical protein